MRSLANQYRRTGGDSARIARIDEAIRALDADKLALLDSLKRTSPYLAHVAAFNTYLSYRFYGQAYPDEISYYMAECFKYVDWKNKDYEYLPWAYETVKSYATTMSSVNLTPEKHLALLEGLLAQIPEDSRTYKLALGGILAGLQSKNHPNYMYFAKKFIDKYKATDMLSCVEVQRQMRSVQSNQIGGEAPDFTMKTPDGEDLSLSDLRGKYVLIDFWASWCGPCRRENPNVVAMYEKYKDKEFEILSVSLDKQKDRWLQAIEKDGLTWRHVSDLKGWQNEAAKTYGVRSIPHTVLVDKEGRIIARNLRGPNLEAKLKEIFGE
ncbi:MAG: TlpA family protein disulfide reductase [Bacteroidetes bacterium]|nr:MAG: TlpA family protein disulfide reductase [Bacteroidota bacterium]